MVRQLRGPVRCGPVLGPDCAEPGRAAPVSVLAEPTGVRRRHTGMKRLALAAIAILVGLGGCAGDANARTQPTGPAQTEPVQKGPPPTQGTTMIDALALCLRALPDRHVVSAAWTTVGDLRAWGHGGPVQQHPLSRAFPNAAPEERAAWCWTREAVDNVTAWGVHGSDP